MSPSPRNGRGGKRQGKPGAQYPNRTDMQRAPRTAGQPVRVATGQPYGQRGQQEASLRALPLPQTPPAGARRAAPVPQPTGPPPGALTPLDAPTARPGEPITTGVDMGPGPGSEILAGTPTDATDVLRGLLQADPDNNALAELISLADQGY